jgi:nucleoside-diphosphate-sugar epimerase
MLVTGASGWLGRNLVRALAQGLADVPALARPAPRRLRCLVTHADEAAIVGRAAPDAACVVGELREPETLAAFVAGAEGATLFHCAGVIHPRRVRDFYAVNVEGTRALLAAAASAGVRRFVHVSSNSPLGSNPDAGHRFDERSPYRPYRHYGRSKKLAEDLVNAAGAAGALETVIVRPPWFYGPGQPARQTRFFEMIERGRMPLVGGGGNLRSMAYVDNLCQGLLLAAAHPAACGQTYWIADRRPYAMREIVATVASLLADEFGRPVARRAPVLPGAIATLAGLADAAIQVVGLYQQEIHVLSETSQHIACSVAKAERELGYDPKIELREGMRRSIAAWLADDRGTA